MERFRPIQKLKEVLNYRNSWMQEKPRKIEPELCYPGEPLSQHTPPFTAEIDKIPQDQEIVLFTNKP